jgi:hypothetical protein
MGGPSFDEVRSRHSFPPSEEWSALPKRDSTITTGERDSPVPSQPLALSVAGSPHRVENSYEFLPRTTACPPGLSAISEPYQKELQEWRDCLLDYARQIPRTVKLTYRR